MRRFESQGDFRAFMRGSVDVTSSTLDFGVEFARLVLPERQIVCVEKIVVKSEIPAFQKQANASLDARINVISGSKEKIKTYIVESNQVKLLDGLFVDFNSSQSFSSLRGDSLIQEFETETYLSQNVLVKVAAKSQNISFVSENVNRIKFEIQLLGYKFLLTDEARQKILKVDV